MECMIKQLRKERNVKAYELAKAIGINKSTLSRIENGKVKFPTYLIAMAIANYLEVETEQLYN